MDISPDLDKQQAAKSADPEDLQVGNDEESKDSLDTHQNMQKPEKDSKPNTGTFTKSKPFKASRSQHFQKFRSFSNWDQSRVGPQGETLYEHHGPVHFGWHRYPPLEQLAASRINRTSQYMYSDET